MHPDRALFGKRTELISGAWQSRLISLDLVELESRRGNWLAFVINDIELPQGDFTTRLVQFRTEVVFSSTLSWVTLVQYDNVSEIVGINSRVHCIPKAGRKAFLVLNHKLRDFDPDNRFHSQFSEAAVKFSYTFRF